MKKITLVSLAFAVGVATAGCTADTEDPPVNQTHVSNATLTPESECDPGISESCDEICASRPGGYWTGACSGSACVCIVID